MKRRGYVTYGLFSLIAFNKVIKNPKKILGFYAGGMVFMYYYLDAYMRYRMDVFYQENSKGLPYFKDKKNVINLETTNFHLDDD